MKLFAHRGYSAKYPENTLLAFQKALETGCYGIELDVHLTGDGQVVVIHDEDTFRTTGVRGKIKDMTAADLSGLDAGLGEAIPTLDAYFALVKDSPVVTNIELKNNVNAYDGMEETVLELIDRYGLRGRILFSSFNHDSIRKCKRLAPDIPCGFLIGAPMDNPAAYVAADKVEFIHPHFAALLEGPFAEECAAEGVPLNVWTVDTFDSITRSARFPSTHALITNAPLSCAAILARM
ncbi:glycerophosphodiester phosphodiesterase [Ruminococcaceae bacterium OttesenSCG-928-L11]|nr:glycerophosphodiester phosphodiesterase [Ruminococcaceae bacterium OttesenSCG-928-L11]